MSSPQRYANGVTNVASGKTMGQFIDTDKTLYQEYWNDFNIYTAADWVVSNTNTGTVVIDEAKHGIFKITCDTGDNDAYRFQLSRDGGTNDSESFEFATGKRGWFKTRFKVSDATQSDIHVGLHITSTDPVGTTPTDGVWFKKVDGSTDITFVVRKNDVESTATVGTLTADTYVVLGYYWDGIDTFHYFLNDVEIGTLTVSTTLPDDEELDVSFMIQNGTTAAAIMYMDYIWAVMER